MGDSGSFSVADTGRVAALTAVRGGFEVQESAVPEPQAGHVLVRTETHAGLRQLTHSSEFATLANALSEGSIVRSNAALDRGRPGPELIAI